MRTPAFSPPERAAASSTGRFAAGAPMTPGLGAVFWRRAVLAWRTHGGNALDCPGGRAAPGQLATAYDCLASTQKLPRVAFEAGALGLHLAFNTADPALVSTCGA